MEAIAPRTGPYQWNLRRQHLGRTLDIGCGIVWNLETLGAGSVGVDHNASSVKVARQLGHDAYTVDEFQERADTLGPFHGLLIAHVIEHMDADHGRSLLEDYLPYLAPGGLVFFVCPQERGYATRRDATCVSQAAMTSSSLPAASPSSPRNRSVSRSDGYKPLRRR